MAAARVIPLSEVAQHATESSCWIAVNGVVFDVTKFAKMHPGGRQIILQYGGQDASEQFELYHDDAIFSKYKKRLAIGTLPGAKQPRGAPAPTSTPEEAYGDMTPWGDPAWYQNARSPYYNASHVEWRHRVRLFVEEHVKPYVREWDEAYKLPKELYRKMYEAGLMPAVVGPPWPAAYVDKPAPKDYDAFHEMILIDELARCGAAGVLWGIIEGAQIGLPPILNFGSAHLRQTVAPPVLRGDKVIALAISEPWAASDVANLRTTAKREGSHYVVNGAKKWITNGLWADYYTTAVRTGGAGMGGLSLLLIPRDLPGVTVRHMKCQGVWSSGTSYITFENVRVPTENLIGEEGGGFKLIMYNFNHERWGLVVQTVRLARICYEDAFNYAMKRKTFGKPLVEHQLIRVKLIEMASKIESCQHWLDHITYQMTVMSKEESLKRLGDVTAMCKVHATKTFELVVREAAQIFGGASYVRSGVGQRVERLLREVKPYAIGGGSEEIMLDFAARQAMKKSLQFQKSNL